MLFIILEHEFILKYIVKLKVTKTVGITQATATYLKTKTRSINIERQYCITLLNIVTGNWVYFLLSDSIVSNKKLFCIHFCMEV